MQMWLKMFTFLNQDQSGMFPAQSYARLLDNKASWTQWLGSKELWVKGENASVLFCKLLYKWITSCCAAPIVHQRLCYSQNTLAFYGVRLMVSVLAPTHGLSSWALDLVVIIIIEGFIPEFTTVPKHWSRNKLGILLHGFHGRGQLSLLSQGL